MPTQNRHRACAMKLTAIVRSSIGSVTPPNAGISQVELIATPIERGGSAWLNFGSSGLGLQATGLRRNVGQASSSSAAGTSLKPKSLISSDSPVLDAAA